ncbi:MAG TPA: GNAT family N-acetyltransferase [Rhodocyclaceae bacterium]|nr:GNAT family N-acetyltransferase [Rhodocyclaceae bacterium]
MRVLLFNSYAEIPATAWNQLAGNQPFLQHAFLAGLEKTDCATAQTGWAPLLLTVWEDDALLAAMPLYAKSHSMGEFVFDWGWAEAYAQHGIPYYPKLVAAVPFSPVQGPRLLAVNDEARMALLEAALAHAEAADFSSLHVLFPLPEEAALLEAKGLLIRQGVQFHWRNNGFKDFEDFLAALTQTKRKKIRQERRRVADAGITLQCLTGSQITPELLAFAYVCYANTYAVRGREPYLSPAFFQHLGATMPDNILLVVASRGDLPIAMALNLYTDDTLWGRYWGELEHVSCLHFEACYYQAIEFCIARGIKLFEGGAQGEHKLARGFLPVTTYSAHWVAHPQFRAAIANFLQRESRGIDAYMDELNEHAPFKPVQ